MQASLYTHIAEHCAPCSAHVRPRLHRARRPATPPAPPVPFVMTKPKPATQPMRDGWRAANYLAQNGHPGLTARQRRRHRHKANRADRRAEAN